MTKDKISVIVPIYNVEQYLRVTLDSIVNQTYKNIEVICINDGSIDNSLSILKEYRKADNRILIIDKKNEGVASARNDAMKIAGGEFFMFVDGDDWLELNACERLMQVMKKYNPDVVMFSYFRDYENKTLKKNNLFPRDLIIFDEIQCRQLNRRLVGAVGEELNHPENFDSISPVWTKLFKGNIIREHNKIQFIDTKIVGTNEDGLMNLLYYQYVNKAVYIDEHLYHYRKTNETSCTAVYKEKLKNQWNNMFEVFQNYIDENNLDENYKNGLQNRIAFSSIGLGLNIVSSKKSILEKYKELKDILYDKRYHEAVKALEFRFLPLHWKLFYGACCFKIVWIYYLLLWAIQNLKNKK